jgi:hypothetical protein
MIPLVSQTPGPTAVPSLPGGLSSARRVAVDASTPTAPVGPLTRSKRQIEPSRPFGGHDRSALGRLILVDHQVLAARVDVVGAERGVASARDDEVGVVV